MNIYETEKSFQFFQKRLQKTSLTNKHDQTLHDEGTWNTEEEDTQYLLVDQFIVGLDPNMRFVDNKKNIENHRPDPLMNPAILPTWNWIQNGNPNTSLPESPA